NPPHRRRCAAPPLPHIRGGEEWRWRAPSPLREKGAPAFSVRRRRHGPPPRLKPAIGAFTATGSARGTPLRRWIREFVLPAHLARHVRYQRQDGFGGAAGSGLPAHRLAIRGKSFAHGRIAEQAED